MIQAGRQSSQASIKGRSGTGTFWTVVYTGPVWFKAAGQFTV